MTVGWIELCYPSRQAESQALLDLQNHVEPSQEVKIHICCSQPLNYPFIMLPLVEEKDYPAFGSGPLIISGFSVKRFHSSGAVLVATPHFRLRFSGLCLLDHLAWRLRMADSVLTKFWTNLCWSLQGHSRRNGSSFIAQELFMSNTNLDAWSMPKTSC